MQKMEKAMKPLKVGEAAPDFVFNEATGQTLHELILQKQCPALVYFYPAAFSPACTAQACMIRNLHRAQDTDHCMIIGVSPQGTGLNRAFQHLMHLPQQLIPDRNRVIGKSYGAVGFLGFYRRLSYIVGVDQKVLMKAEGGLALAAHRVLAERFFEVVSNYKTN